MHMLAMSSRKLNNKTIFFLLAKGLSAAPVKVLLSSIWKTCQMTKWLWELPPSTPSTMWELGRLNPTVSVTVQKTNNLTLMPVWHCKWPGCGGVKVNRIWTSLSSSLFLPFVHCTIVFAFHTFPFSLEINHFFFNLMCKPAVRSVFRSSDLWPLFDWFSTTVLTLSPRSHSPVSFFKIALFFVFLNCRISC